MGMAETAVPFDVDRIPGLAELAAEVQSTQTTRELQRAGETVAVLMRAPAPLDPPTTRRRSNRARTSTLLGLAAIADEMTDRPAGPTDIARNKHAYLAAAYAAEATPASRR
jgi:hypothetical protein